MISHRTTDIDELIDRYLLREMTPELEAEWEAHYFECGECFQRLERIQAVKEGVAAAPIPVGVHSASASASRSRRGERAFWSPPRLAFALAVVAGAIAPTIVMWNQVRSLNDELARARQPMVVGSQLVLQEGIRGGEAVAELKEDPGSGLLIQFSLPRPVGDESPVDAKIVARESGRVIWGGAGIHPIGPYGVFAILCPSEALPSGSYELQVTQESGSPSSGPACFEFRVKRP